MSNQMNGMIAGKDDDEEEQELLFDYGNVTSQQATENQVVGADQAANQIAGVSYDQDYVYEGANDLISRPNALDLLEASGVTDLETYYRENDMKDWGRMTAAITKELYSPAGEALSDSQWVARMNDPAYIERLQTIRDDIFSGEKSRYQNEAYGGGRFGYQQERQARADSGTSSNAQAQTAQADSGTTSQQPLTREDLVAKVQELTAQVAQMQMNQQEMQAGVETGTSKPSLAEYVLNQRPQLASNSDDDEEEKQKVTRNLADKRTQSTMSPGKLFDAWRMSRRGTPFT